MDAHVIGPTQRVFDIDIFDPRLVFLDSARVSQIHRLLNRGHVFMVLIRRVVTKNVHVEARALLDQRQPDPSCADDRNHAAYVLRTTDLQSPGRCRVKPNNSSATAPRSSISEVKGAQTGRLRRRHRLLSTRQSRLRRAVPELPLPLCDSGRSLPSGASC